MPSAVNYYGVAARLYQMITGQQEATDERSFRTHPSFGSGKSTLRRYNPYCLCRQAKWEIIVGSSATPSANVSHWGGSFITLYRIRVCMISLLA